MYVFMLYMMSLLLGPSVSYIFYTVHIVLYGVVHIITVTTGRHPPIPLDICAPPKSRSLQ